jgi:hypothetical protein
MPFKTVRSRLVDKLQHLILDRAAVILAPGLKALGFEGLKVSGSSGRRAFTGRWRFPPYDETFCLRVRSQGAFGRLSVETGWLDGEPEVQARFVPDACVLISVWHLKSQWAELLATLSVQMLARVMQLAQAQIEEAQAAHIPAPVKPIARRRSIVYEGDAISKLIAEFEAELPVEIDEYMAKFFVELSASSR